jgi:hypothetical protein
MLFDPEDGMTWEQSLEIAWKRLPPAIQARVQRLADTRGWTRSEVILECCRSVMEDLKDPAKAAAYHAKMDRQEAPFGPDPLVRKNA